MDRLRPARRAPGQPACRAPGQPARLGGGAPWSTAAWMPRSCCLAPTRSAQGDMAPPPQASVLVPASF